MKKILSSAPKMAVTVLCMSLFQKWSVLSSAALVISGNISKLINTLYMYEYKQKYITHIAKLLAFQSFASSGTQKSVLCLEYPLKKTAICNSLLHACMTSLLKCLVFYQLCGNRISTCVKMYLLCPFLMDHCLILFLVEARMVDLVGTVHLELAGCHQSFLYEHFQLAQLAPWMTYFQVGDW